MTHQRSRCVLALVAAFALAGAAPASAQAPTPAAERLASFAARQQMEQRSILRELTYRNIGPIQMNGRLVDVEFPDPKNPYTFLLVYASGGLWKTTNNGTTFEPLMDAQSSIVMGDVAVDPRNPNVYWVGTGEKNESRSTYSGTGVFRTTDGGKTWTHMGLADTQRIARIVVSPRDSNTVWVAAQGPLYTDSDARGVYMTTDGGKTWKKTLYVDEQTGASDLAIHPRNPKILYAGMWQKDRKAWKNTPNGPNGGVYRSEDGGVTWKKLTSGLPSGDGLGRIGLAVTPAAPDTLFVTVDNQTAKPDKDQPKDDAPLSPAKLQTMTEAQFLALKDSDIQAFLRRSNTADSVAEVRQLVKDGKLTVKAMLHRLLQNNASLLDKEVIAAQLFRSNDRGNTFTQANTNYLDGVYSTFGYYFADFAVSPKDANTIYLLGVPLIKSTDGGKTWKSIGGRGVHSDHHALWIDPNFPDHILNGNDGGLNISWDGGKTFIDVANIPVGQFYSLAVDMADPYNVYGGLQDNGVYMGRSDEPAASNEWRSIGGGDGMQVQVDTRTNKLYIRGSQYGSYRATDETTNKNWTVRPLSHITEAMNRYNWQTPILLSPHTPEILYYGTQRLYRSFDQGHTFAAISGDLTGDHQPNVSDTPYSTLVTISESPRTFGLIYVGSDDGMVHVTKDGGATWTNVSDGLAKARYVSRVIASKYEDGVAYATQTGYRDDDWHAYLFRTADYGKTWMSIKGDMPDEPVNVIREESEAPRDPLRGHRPRRVCQPRHREDLADARREPAARAGARPAGPPARERARRRHARPQRLHPGREAPPGPARPGGPGPRHRPAAAHPPGEGRGGAGVVDAPVPAAAPRLVLRAARADLAVLLLREDGGQGHAHHQGRRRQPAPRHRAGRHRRHQRLRVERRARRRPGEEGRGGAAGQGAGRAPGRRPRAARRRRRRGQRFPSRTG